jgi:hypothetical protein
VDISITSTWIRTHTTGRNGRSILAEPFNFAIQAIQRYLTSIGIVAIEVKLDPETFQLRWRSGDIS